MSTVMRRVVNRNRDEPAEPVMGRSVLQSDRAFKEMMSKLQSNHIRFELNVPVLGLIAQQSTGKSLFVDYLVGYPVSFSANTKGTLCPIRYSLRRCAPGAEERFVVNGQQVPAEGVAAAVKEHMRLLNGTFSSQELTVEISSSDSMDIDLLDLPGFPIKDAEHYDEVVKLLRQLVAQPNFVIVAMGNGGHADPMAQPHMSLLDEVLKPVRPRWRDEHIMVLNFVNDALPKMHTADEFASYFNGTLAANRDTYFTMMIPNHENLAAMSIEERVRFLAKNRATGELAFFNEHKRRVGCNAGSRLAPNVEQRVGVQRVCQALHMLLAQKIRQQLPVITARADERIRESEAEKAKLMQLLKVLDLGNLRRMYREFSSAVSTTVRSLSAGTRTNVFADPAVSGQFRCSMNTLAPACDALTFAEECTLAHRSQQLVDAGDLERMLVSRSDARQGLCKRLTMKLSGDAAIQRSLQVFMLLVLKHPTYVPREEEAYQVGIASLTGVSGSLDTKKVIHYITEGSLLDVCVLVPWLCEHLDFLMRRRGEVAQKFQCNLPKFEPIAAHSGFLDLVATKYREIALSIVSGFADDFNSAVKEHASTVQLDAYVRTMALLTQIPYTNDVGTRRSFEPTKLTESEQLPTEVDEATARQRAMTVIPVGAGQVRATVSNGIAQREQACRRIIETMREHKDAFTLLDAIENGIVAPVDHYAVHFDLQEVVAQAETHVYFAKLQLIMQVERHVAVRFSQRLHDEVPERLHAELENRLAEMSEEDVRILSECTVDVPAVQAQAERLERQTAALRDALQCIRAFERGASSTQPVAINSSDDEHDVTRSQSSEGAA